jgi:hypothetical protein
MSKAVREFFEQIKTAENPGILASVREIGGKLWDNAKPMFDHGRKQLRPFSPATRMSCT